MSRQRLNHLLSGDGAGTQESPGPSRIVINDAIKTYMEPDKEHYYKGEDDPVIEYGGGSLLSAPVRKRLTDSGALPSNMPQKFAAGLRDSIRTGRWDEGGATAEAVLQDVIGESFDPGGLDISDRWEFRDDEFVYNRPKWSDKHLSVMKFIEEEVAPKIGDVGSQSLRDQMITMSMLKKYGIDLEDYLAAQEAGAVDTALAGAKLKTNPNYLHLAR